MPGLDSRTNVAPAPRGARSADDRWVDEHLSGRPWTASDRPFCHVVTTALLRPVPAAAVANQFRAIKDGRGELGFARRLETYSAQSVPFARRPEGPLGELLSPVLFAALASVFGVTTTGDINAGLHLHPPGSPPGYVHNDYNPGYFPRSRTGDEQFSDSRVCDYRNGQNCGDPIRRMRSVAAIYFTGNGPWSPGDGGELGLFSSSAAADLVLSVPPQDNTLVAFECQPTAFHAFLGSNVRPRASVIFWLHSAAETAQSRWGIDKVVDWPKDASSG